MKRVLIIGATLVLLVGAALFGMNAYIEDATTHANQYVASVESATPSDMGDAWQVLTDTTRPARDVKRVRFSRATPLHSVPMLDLLNRPGVAFIATVVDSEPSTLEGAHLFFYVKRTASGWKTATWLSDEYSDEYPDAPKPESPVATVWAFERMEPSPQRASLVWKGSNIKPEFEDPFGIPESVERYPETYPMRKQYPDLAGWHDMAVCVVKYPTGEVTFWDLGRETPQSQWVILGAAHAP